MRLFLLACLCASGIATAADMAVAIRPVVNLFSKPTEDVDVVSQAIYGTNVEVMEAADAWWHIRTPDRYTGWVQAAAFTRASKAYASEGKVAEVVNLFAHLYRERSVTRHAPLVTVPFETRLELGAGEDERWLEVRLPDGRAGWVQRGDVAVGSGKFDIQRMISVSKRFLGLPYTWGGTSSFGYDCSGFTQMLVRRRGILMPRDADDQAAWEGVSAVEKDAVMAGDLLYFGPSVDKITHTGLYIGDGEFIHATTHDRPVIQISRLGDPHWTKLLVCARRVKEGQR